MPIYGPFKQYQIKYAFIIKIQGFYLNTQPTFASKESFKAANIWVCKPKIMTGQQDNLCKILI